MYTEEKYIYRFKPTMFKIKPIIALVKFNSITSPINLIRRRSLGYNRDGAFEISDMTLPVKTGFGEISSCSTNSCL